MLKRRAELNLPICGTNMDQPDGVNIQADLIVNITGTLHCFVGTLLKTHAADTQADLGLSVFIRLCEFEGSKFDIV